VVKGLENKLPTAKILEDQEAVRSLEQQIDEWNKYVLECKGKLEEIKFAHKCECSSMTSGIETLGTQLAKVRAENAFPRAQMAKVQAVLACQPPT
jgi:hypothetical protein